MFVGLRKQEKANNEELETRNVYNFGEKEYTHVLPLFVAYRDLFKKLISKNIFYNENYFWIKNNF
jgi:hypothetical protein